MKKFIVTWRDTKDNKVIGRPFEIEANTFIRALTTSSVKQLDYRSIYSTTTLQTFNVWIIDNPKLYKVHVRYVGE